MILISLLLSFFLFFHTVPVDAQSCQGGGFTVNGFASCQGDPFLGYTCFTHSEQGWSTCGGTDKGGDCQRVLSTTETCTIPPDGSSCSVKGEVAYTGDGCTVVQPTSPPPTNTPIPSSTPRPPTNAPSSTPRPPTSTPTVTLTPTPTTPPPQNCTGEGGSCNNSEQCCGALECDTTFTNTCVYLSGQGGCEQDKCDGNKCNTHYYNPDANGNCNRNNQCNFDSDCCTCGTAGCNNCPPPVGSCTVSLDPNPVTISGSNARVYGTLVKDQPGGAIACGGVIITESGGADCRDWGWSNTCDVGTTPCYFEIGAYQGGTCTIGFDCVNVQNSAPITCSTTLTVVKPTNTPTPLPPTQGAWRKFKDAAALKSSRIRNPIPTYRLPFAIEGNVDSEDSPAGSNFVRGEAGVVVSKNTIATLDNTNISSHDWTAQNYSPAFPYNKATFWAYVKARKNYKTITSFNSDLSQLATSDIYYKNGTVTITGNPASDFVLIVDGDVHINTGSDNFNYRASDDTPRHSVAIFADNIYIDGSEEHVYAILIAENTIDTGTSDKGLKIKGNVIGENVNNNRIQP